MQRSGKVTAIEAAHGVLAVVTSNMERALRQHLQSNAAADPATSRSFRSAARAVCMRWLWRARCEFRACCCPLLTRGFVGGGRSARRRG